MLNEVNTQYFDEFYNEYASSVYGYILKKMPNSEEAEIMLIEVFVIALKTPQFFSEKKEKRLIDLLKIANSFLLRPYSFSSLSLINQTNV